MGAEQQPRLVVGAAILRDGRLLAARRSRPPELAGRWELPGGKVEPGESPEEACVRECREELAVEVEVVRRLGPALPIRPGLSLWVYENRLAGGEPSTGPGHDALRWLGAHELDDVDWLDPDRPLLPVLRARLVGGAGR